MGQFFFTIVNALQGDTEWGFWGDCLNLVMDLQVRGMLYVIFFSLPPQSLTTSTGSPSSHSRLHNHCTAHKGLSSQVQPRLARIKEHFQHKMFFPFFFQTASSLFFLLFLFLLVLSSVFLPILLHFSRISSISYPINLVIYRIRLFETFFL